jgi:hypothetical protein
MKLCTKLFAVLAIVAMVSAVNAADDKGAPPAKTTTLKGKVVKVDGKSVVVSTGKKSAPKEVTVATDDKTVVTIEGKDAKLSDLQPGQKVVITPDTGTATKIEVPTPKAKKDAK